MRMGAEQNEGVEASLSAEVEVEAELNQASKHAFEETSEENLEEVQAGDPSSELKNAIQCTRILILNLHKL